MRGNNLEYEEVKRRLEEWLADVEKLMVLGVGNELRGDDAVGVLVARSLKHFNGDRFEAVECGVSLEACVDYALEKKPSHLLIVDAFPDGGKLVLLDTADLESHTPVSTHAIPLPLLLDVFKPPSEASVKVLGIGVENFKLGTVVSDEYREVAEKVASIIRVAAATLSLL
ncbi:MAG: hydrogenase maturation protease [Thermoproteota archaeon]